MKLVRSVLLISMFSALTVSATAQDLRFFATMRERTELDARPVDRTIPMDVYHLLRTRFGMNAQLNSQVRVAIELQDARTFGSEASLLNQGSPAFDMRQGFIEAGKLAGDGVMLRLGRTPLAYGNERLLGLNDWGNFGQSFDGLMARYTSGEISVDVLAYALTRYSHLPHLYNRDVFLTGAWFAWKPATVKSALNLYYFFDNPKSSTSAQYRHTAGLYAAGSYGDFDYEIDAAGQFGTVDPADSALANFSIAANLVGVRLGYTLKDAADLRIGVGYDRYSGNDPNSKDYGSFSPLYGTKHKFLGFMDYFTQFPLHTMNLGIQDIMLQASLVPDTDMKLAADFHLFSTAVDPLDYASIRAAQPEASSSIGVELDLTFAWKMFDKLNMTAGYSTFNRSADSPVLQGKKTTGWGYLMTSVSI